jgi:hypothetical protein
LNNSREDKHRGKKSREREREREREIEKEKKRKIHTVDPHGKSNKGRKGESEKPRKSDIRTFAISCGVA